MAKWAGEGADIVVVCATAARPARSATRRRPCGARSGRSARSELRQACAISGCADVVMLDYHDGALHDVDAAELDRTRRDDPRRRRSRRDRHVRRQTVRTDTPTTSRSATRRRGRGSASGERPKAGTARPGPAPAQPLPEQPDLAGRTARRTGWSSMDRPLRRIDRLRPRPHAVRRRVDHHALRQRRRADRVVPAGLADRRTGRTGHQPAADPVGHGRCGQGRRRRRRLHHLQSLGEGQFFGELGVAGRRASVGECHRERQRDLPRAVDHRANEVRRSRRQRRPAARGPSRRPPSLRSSPGSCRST